MANFSLRVSLAAVGVCVAVSLSPYGVRLINLAKVGKIHFILVYTDADPDFLFSLCPTQKRTELVADRDAAPASPASVVAAQQLRLRSCSVIHVQ